MPDVPLLDLRAALKVAVADNAYITADALESIQLGTLVEERLDLEGVRAAARYVRRQNDFEQFLLEQLDARGLTGPMMMALIARGVVFPEKWEAAVQTLPGPHSVAADVAPRAIDDTAALADGQEDVPDDDEAFEAGQVQNLGEFEDRARAIRCRILVNGIFAGSGFLVGPSTVMTAWHVVSGVAAGQPPKIEVAFTDGQILRAIIPVSIYSECSARERQGELPRDDAEVATLHDVALLTLQLPAGATFGVARLSKSRPLRSADKIFVAHFPEGNDLGLGLGDVRKLRGLTHRLGHTARTREGSSGAGCFNTSFEIAGVHQGRASKPALGRLVPVERFPPEILAEIARDEAPPDLWSLDGTIEGKLVIGRREFFAAFAAASRADTRIRGMRIKRANAAADESGIPFSYEMLAQMVVRSVDTLAIRISFDTIVEDFADEVVRRAAEIALDVPPVAALAGVDIGDTSPGAVANDRGRRVATSLDAALAARGQRLWVFIEHPSAVFGEPLRAALDGFVDQALRLPNLRLAIAGYEAVSMPGLEFVSAATAGQNGPPGLIVEYIGSFRRIDVEDLFRKAARALGDNPGAEFVRRTVDEVLEGIAGINDTFATSTARDVTEGLRPPLRRIARAHPGAAPPAEEIGNG